MEHESIDGGAPADTGASALSCPQPSGDARALAEAAVVEDELLVEEISIDGMCGVY